MIVILLNIILVLTFLTDRAVHPTSIHSEYVSAKYLTSEINTEFIMLTEQFKPIKGYEGLYEISNFGRVKSLERIIKNSGTRGNYMQVKESILKFLINKGYAYVCLSKVIQKKHRIHHLVWDTFGDKPRDGRKLQVDHIDGDKLNNRFDNLQLLTPRENVTKYRLTINKKLPIGVFANGNSRRFLAKISIKGKPVILGYFDTIAEAKTAYQNKLNSII